MRETNPHFNIEFRRYKIKNGWNIPEYATTPPNKKRKNKYLRKEEANVHTGGNKEQRK